MDYCYSKLQTRFEKLKRDIIFNQHNEYIKKFVKFASINVDNLDNVNLRKLSVTCYRYWQSVKKNPLVPKFFLGHLKKVGSYHGSLKDIVSCARNEKYRKLFSNVKLRKLDSVVGNNYVFSWSNIIKRFILDPKEYKDFEEACLEDSFIADRLRSIYGVNEGEDEILLNFEDIEQHVRLHAEMNLVADIINRDYRGRSFIAVSKRCCYLCELYIQFANNNGYNLIISGKHKMIYHAWKLPNIKNSKFNEESVSYLIDNLDQIIKDETEQHRVFTPTSDNREVSRDTNDDDDDPDEDYEISEDENDI
jgi:hypothetical protein